MSLVARYLEAQGIPPLCLASALDIIKAGNPPRAVYLDYPLGHTAGRPFDTENQRAVIHDALNAFEAIRTPGVIKHLSYRWSDNESWKIQEANTEQGDARAPRGTEPQYQTETDRIAAEVLGSTRNASVF